jgi:lysozyme
MPRLLNLAGMALIKEYEGYEAHAYLDTGGVWTCGYGHTRGVTQGVTCTPAQAEKWLEDDLASAVIDVCKLVKVPLTDNQFAALVSFTFNLGGPALAKSTLLRELNSGNYEAVPTQLKFWVFDNGKRLKGLERRRAAEANLWNIK